MQKSEKWNKSTAVLSRAYGMRTRHEFSIGASRFLNNENVQNHSKNAFSSMIDKTKEGAVTISYYLTRKKVIKMATSEMIHSRKY